MSPLQPPTSAPRAGRRGAGAWRLWPSWPLSAWSAVVVSLLFSAWGAATAWVLMDGLPGWSGGARLHPALAVVAGLLAATLPLTLLLVKASGDLQQGRKRVQLAGLLDPVTGLASRTPFCALAERELARSRRYGIGAALLLIDVDRFRRLVDGHERSVGDLVLQQIAGSTQATLRASDAVARFGPAQLAVFLAHADPLGALDVAERIRERVESLELSWHDRRLRTTVSVGVALMRPAHPTLQSVVDDAEAALGAARHAGGNCVRAAPVDPRRLPPAGSHGPSVGDNQAAGS